MPPLPNDIATHQGMVRELLATVADLRSTVQVQRHRIDDLTRRPCGKKSERVTGDNSTPGDVPLLSVTLPSPPPRRGRGRGRRPLPDHPAREWVEFDLSEAERARPCCGEPRARIGAETSEQLDYRPAFLFVIQRVWHTYACRLWSRTADPADRPVPTIATAPLPTRPIDRGCSAGACWPTSWCPSSPTTCRSTVSTASWSGRGWTSPGPASAAGSPPRPSGTGPAVPGDPDGRHPGLGPCPRAPGGRGPAIFVPARLEDNPPAPGGRGPATCRCTWGTPTTRTRCSTTPRRTPGRVRGRGWVTMPGTSRPTPSSSTTRCSTARPQVRPKSVLGLCEEEVPRRERQ